MTDTSDWFNPAALFIMFREALEAAVILAVLLQLMSRLGMHENRRWVWLGAFAGTAISVVIGAVFIAIYYAAQDALFEGDAQMIFKGTTGWVASLLITMVAFIMLRFYGLERKWRRKLEGAVGSRADQVRSSRWSMFLLAGSATLREGMESVIFLLGVSQGDDLKAVIAPGLLGIGLGCLAGAAIYFSGRSIRSLRWFFVASAGLLLFIAAGMLCSGTGQFQGADLFGVMSPYEDRPWANQVAWDASSCCDPDTNGFWALMRTLFGWQDQPTNLQVLYYFLYWAVVGALVAYKIATGTLTDEAEARLADAKSMAARRAAPAGIVVVKGGGAPGGDDAADADSGSDGPKDSAKDSLDSGSGSPAGSDAGADDGAAPPAAAAAAAAS